MPTNNFTADGGEWNTAGNWSLGHVPTTTEDVTFTGIVTPGVNLTITTTSAECLACDFSGAATFILSGTGNIRVRGNLTVKSGMTWSHSAGLYFYNNTANFDTNGVSLAVEYIYIQGVQVTLINNNLTCAYLALRGSTSILVTNNLTVTTGTFGDASTAGNVTLTLGSSTINCTNVSFGSCTLTVSDNTATINVTSTVDITSHLGGVAWGTGGDTIFHYHMTGGKVLTLNGANTVGDFLIDWTTANIASAWYLGANQVISGTLTITGSSTIDRPYIVSSASGTQRTITAANTSITGALLFRDIVGAGAGSWDLSGNASGNLGGNSGITFRTPATYYAVTLTANRNWRANIWSTTDDGTADGTGVFPLPQDTVIINNNTGDNSGKVLTLNDWFTCNIDASACTEALGITFGGWYYLGDLILTGLGLTITGGGSTAFDARLKYESSDVIEVNIPTSYGNNSISISSFGGNGTVKLLANLTNTNTFALTIGKVDLNGKILTTDNITSSNTNSREIKDSAGGGKLVVNCLTGNGINFSTATDLAISNSPSVDMGDSTRTLTGDVTLNMGGQTYGNLSVKKHAGNYSVIIN